MAFSDSRAVPVLGRSNRGSYTTSDCILGSTMWSENSKMTYFLSLLILGTCTVEASGISWANSKLLRKVLYAMVDSMFRHVWFPLASIRHTFCHHRYGASLFFAPSMVSLKPSRPETCYLRVCSRYRPPG